MHWEGKNEWATRNKQVSEQANIKNKELWTMKMEAILMREIMWFAHNIKNKKASDNLKWIFMANSNEKRESLGKKTHVSELKLTLTLLQYNTHSIHDDVEIQITLFSFLQRLKFFPSHSISFK